MLNRFGVIGLNYKTAAIEQRESLASDQKLQTFLQKMKFDDQCLESGLYLNTCNRVEIYYNKHKKIESINMLDQWIKTNQAQHVTHTESMYYQKNNMDALRHLFKVASSLDSMVLGEAQITSQLKMAYDWSCNNNFADETLHFVVQKALSVSKKIKTDTDIAKQAVSISYVAVELAKKIFGSLDKSQALLLGAGEMAELCLKHLHSKQLKDIIVCNRSIDKAAHIANHYQASFAGLESMHKYLITADVVIVSTHAEHFLLNQIDLKKIMQERKYKPLFMIDISVPRNIDPECSVIDQLYLYNIDDLQNVSDKNLSQRKKEAQKAFVIIEEQLQQTKKTLAIKEKQVWIEKLKHNVFEKIRKETKTISNINDKDRSNIEQALLKKMIAEPIAFLKQDLSPDDMAVFKAIFNLDDY